MTEKNYYKNMNFTQKKEFMNFRIKEKFMLWISGRKRRSFPTQQVGRKMIFP